MVDVRDDPNWYQKYSKWILRPGCLRRCLFHNDNYVEDTVDVDAEEFHPCRKCPNGFTKSGYSESAWRNRHREPGAVCLKCEAKEKVWQCQGCKRKKPTAAFSSSMWHHRRDPDLRRVLCLDCEGGAEERQACGL